jgi:2-phosphosulfolactate phosphatase
VLRFSSATASAVHHGVSVVPHAWLEPERAAELASALGAEHRAGALSPLAFSASDRGRRLLVCSPNGAACADLARSAVALLTGALVNARAAAAYARARAAQHGAAVSVIACGELWDDAPVAQPVLRPCLEDYLGAGAILRGLAGEASPEAAVCRDAFAAAEPRLAELLWECASGRELRARERGDDVTWCAALDRLESVPVLSAGALRAAA